MYSKITLKYQNVVIGGFLCHYNPFQANVSFIPPEDFRKSEILLRFQGVEKWNIDVKLVNVRGNVEVCLIIA